MKAVNVTIGETKKGDPMKTVELDNGHSFNVFSWHSLYPKIKEGYDIQMDDLYQKGGYINLVDPEKGMPDGAEPADFDAIEEKQDKQASRKEYSIKLSSTARMAADMVTAEFEELDSKSKRGLQDRWKMWRRFFWDQWEHPEDYTDPDDIID